MQLTVFHLSLPRHEAHSSSTTLCSSLPPPLSAHSALSSLATAPLRPQTLAWPWRRRQGSGIGCRGVTLCCCDKIGGSGEARSSGNETGAGLDYHDSCEPDVLRKLRIAQQQQQASRKQQQEDTSAHSYSQPSPTTVTVAGATYSIQYTDTCGDDNDDNNQIEASVPSHDGRKLHVGRLFWKRGMPDPLDLIEEAEEWEKEGENDNSTSTLQTVVVLSVNVAKEFRGRRCGAILFNLLARRMRHHHGYSDAAVVEGMAIDRSKDGNWHLLCWYASLSFELMQPFPHINDMAAVQRLKGLPWCESVKKVLQQTPDDMFPCFKLVYPVVRTTAGALRERTDQLLWDKGAEGRG